ncbi:major facilitator superfamily domain-containing protein 6-like isoform X2 [Palaemon carinicauda]|uniref:major facilitator superfamily domain-containing protein 6-like isoform X2 n=1 Tax=Palaemon carinicauda TaxID=392227 RepID=UPI0035B5E1AE
MGMAKFHVLSNKIKTFFIEEIKNFTKDFINPKLLLLKCNYFFLLSAVVILWPQITIHQKSLGLTEYHTGTIASVISASNIIFPILGGCVGDKVGNYKILMAIFSLISGALAYSFTWIPSAVIEIPASNTSGTLLNSSFEANSSASNSVMKITDEDQLEITFWIYLCVLPLYVIFFSITHIFLDAAVMANTQIADVNYGYQRAWGTMGALVSSYVGGVIVGKTGSFTEIFYISAALQTVSAILMLTVNISFKIPAISLTKKFFQQLFRPEPILLIGVSFFAGMFQGYFETFMYLFLFDLGGSTELLGLTVTVGAPFEFVMTLVTCNLAKSFGYGPFITLGVLLHAVHHFGVCLIENPWWILPLEAVGSASNGFFMTSSMGYITILVQTETIASFLGLFKIIHDGAGRMLGTLIGTELRKYLTHKEILAIWGSIAVATAIIYCSAYYALKKHRSTSNSTEHEPEQEQKGANSKKELSGIDNKACEAEL